VGVHVALTHPSQPKDITIWALLLWKTRCVKIFTDDIYISSRLLMMKHSDFLTHAVIFSLSCVLSFRVLSLHIALRFVFAWAWFSYLKGCDRDRVFTCDILSHQDFKRMLNTPSLYSWTWHVTLHVTPHLHSCINWYTSTATYTH